MSVVGHRAHDMFSRPPFQFTYNPETVLRCLERPLSSRGQLIPPRSVGGPGPPTRGGPEALRPLKVLYCPLGVRSVASTKRYRRLSDTDRLGPLVLDKNCVISPEPVGRYHFLSHFRPCLYSPLPSVLCVSYPDPSPTPWEVGPSQQNRRLTCPRPCPTC